MPRPSLTPLSPREKATCQICGRLIGYKRGLIAHHGYSRPHPYMQTSSCFGARALAFEQDRTLILQYIQVLENTKAHIAELIIDMRTHNRPITLRPARMVRGHMYEAVVNDSSNPAYPINQRNWLASRQSESSAIEFDIRYFQKRWRDWKPTTA